MQTDVPPRARSTLHNRLHLALPADKQTYCVMDCVPALLQLHLQAEPARTPTAGLRQVEPALLQQRFVLARTRLL